MSGGGEEETRTTQADISHVDKQIQDRPCPFFQFIHGLLMQPEFRRIEERKMARGRFGGGHGAVELLLPGTFLFDP